jgi:hypothetical protein
LPTQRKRYQDWFKKIKTLKYEGSPRRLLTVNEQLEAANKRLEAMREEDEKKKEEVIKKWNQNRIQIMRSAGGSNVNVKKSL